ncbi:hypothetical protein D9M71_472510 [compost metagenome]
MADFRHQRQGRQRFEAYARLAGIDHRQAQFHRLPLRLAARRHQQPFGIEPSGDEVLAAAQAQVIQTHLHVRRAHAAPLAGAQGTEALRRARPQHPQGCLITDQKGQARGGHGPPAEHRQLERADRAQARQQAGIGVGQIGRLRVSLSVVESLQPGHRSAP